MAKNNNLTDFLTGVADAIRTKKGTSSPINPQDFESEIENIQTGVDTADATATAADIRAGKTAYVTEEKVEGSIQDYNGEIEPASGVSLVDQLISGSLSELKPEFLKNVTRIKRNLFSQDLNLTKATIPDNVKDLGGSIFYGCKELTDVALLYSGTSVPYSTFDGCEKLNRVIISETITSIGENAFRNCCTLNSIVLPKNLTRISRYAFNSCRSITEIELPDKLTYIGDSAFESCTSIAEITIPSGVTALLEYSFSDCKKISNIVISENVSSIRRRAFARLGINTEQGSVITIRASTPPTITSESFTDAKISKIIVPAGCGDAYKSATNWSAYADYIEEESE